MNCGLVGEMERKESANARRPSLTVRRCQNSMSDVIGTSAMPCQEGLASVRPVVRLRESVGGVADRVSATNVQ